MESPKTLAITGQPPERLYGGDLNHPDYTRLAEKIRTLVANAYDHGYRTFISGMGEGVDTLFAQAVLRLRSEQDDARLVCAVPYPGQATRWLPAARTKWLEILERADQIVLTNADLVVSVAELKRRMDQSGLGGIDPDSRHRFVEQRDWWMVRKAETLLAVWDLRPGDTAQALRMAKQHGIRVIKLDPVTLATSML